METADAWISISKLDKIIFIYLFLSRDFCAIWWRSVWAGHNNHLHAATTYPFRVLQEPLIGLLSARFLQKLLPIGQDSVHMGLVFDRQIQSPGHKTTHWINAYLPKSTFRSSINKPHMTDKLLPLLIFLHSYKHKPRKSTSPSWKGQC